LNLNKRIVKEFIKPSLRYTEQNCTHFSCFFQTLQGMSIMSPGVIVIYTDGSFCDGRAGAGVYSETLNIKESFTLGAHATVFQTEVYAIRTFVTMQDSG
jgi:hypothetical protein